MSPRPRRRPSLAVLSLAALVLAPGCVGGPSYSGGPREDEPHATLVTGPEVSVWRVDGWDTVTRAGEFYLSPGHHTVRVRYEYPIESDAQTPFEVKELSLDVTAGQTWGVSRTGEGEFGPFSVEAKPLAPPR